MKQIPVFIGGTTAISAERLLAIIDWQYFARGSNQLYLQQNPQVHDITEGSPPQSLVITDKDLYISSISPLTLKRRTDKLKKGIYD